MKPYVFKEHTADIIAQASGASLENAFAAIAQALFDVITDGSEIENDRERTIEVSSIDREGLLVGFLSDLIVLHETEDEVYGNFEIRMLPDHRLTAVCRGERFDPERHGEGTPVKGISYHMLEIAEPSTDQRLWSIQVLFDI